LREAGETIPRSEKFRMTRNFGTLLLQLFSSIL
jgi:hypothetical protein